MRITSQKLYAKCCKTTWNGSVLATSSMQYVWEAFEPSDLYRVFKTVQMASLRTCAVFLVGRWIGSRTGNVQRKGPLSVLVFLVFGSYDSFMSALIGFFDFSWVFFNFFGVRYCKFCLTACKLVKKQDRSEVSRSFPCNLIFRHF